jgi:hypothetical protein
MGTATGVVTGSGSAATATAAPWSDPLFKHLQLQA